MATALPTRRAAARAVAIIAGLATAVSLAACSGTSSPSSSNDAKTIGIVSYDTTVVSAKAETDSAKAAIEKAGWTAISQDPKGDPSQANTICTQYVTRHVNAIVISVFSDDQMAQCTSGAKTANIPVFFLASSLSAGMAGAISTNLEKPINQKMISDVKDLPNLKILAMTLQPGAPCRAREADLDTELEAAGLSQNLEKHEVVVPGQVTDAQAATTAWLSAHPASKGESLVIWACFSDPAVGAASAIKQAGRSGIPIYTWDLTKQDVDYIKDGTFTAVLAINSAGEGEQLVSQMKSFFAGGSPQGEDAASDLLTKANIDDYLSKNPDAAN